MYKFDNKILLLDTGESLTKASVDKVKPYLETFEIEDTVGDMAFSATDLSDLVVTPQFTPFDEVVNTDAVFGTGKVENTSPYDYDLNDVIQGIHVADDANLNPEHNEETLDSISPDVAYVGVFITEILDAGDARPNSPDLNRAKRMEIEGLKTRKG